MLKSNKDLVSVVIPTKNEEVNIEKLLLSIKNQTYNNIEIIIVDNNSADKTKKISRKYTDLIFNKGPERSAQRNFGAACANGKYLLFLDADMELTKKVIEKCVYKANNYNARMIIVPEVTMGNTLLAKIRRFEREMYMGDSTIEVPRFFDKEIFNKYKGYDETLTGTEDYDLPYRISKKYKYFWIDSELMHHEENLTLSRILKKKYYYAKNSASYVNKHPELIKTQGNMLFRKSFFKNWKKFVRNPFIGIIFIFEKTLEFFWALAGFISAFGLKKLFKLVFRQFLMPS